MSIWENTRNYTRCVRCNDRIYQYNEPHCIKDCIERLAERVASLEQEIEGLREFINNYVSLD